MREECEKYVNRVGENEEDIEWLMKRVKLRIGSESVSDKVDEKWKKEWEWDRSVGMCADALRKRWRKRIEIRGMEEIYCKKEI